jgi:ubiquinone/menaquinone biosynthesis C-methylase UbiE
MSIYKADDALGYGQSMGRWSALLAPLFIEFANVNRADRFLDVGCGTGSLTFALAKTFQRASIVGMDYSQVFVDHAAASVKDATNVCFEQGDAAALRYDNEVFDATLSLLVLNFVPDAEQAAREMRRVTRKGCVVAAAVWDFKGGLTFLRVMADTAAALDESGEQFRAKQFSAPFTGPGELARVWTAMGMKEVAQTSLTIRMEFASFADYWTPWLKGQGTVGAYISGLDAAKRNRLEKHVRSAFLAGAEDGPRSFTATAWAVRGIV